MESRICRGSGGFWRGDEGLVPPGCGGFWVSDGRRFGARWPTKKEVICFPGKDKIVRRWLKATKIGQRTGRPGTMPS